MNRIDDPVSLDRHSPLGAVTVAILNWPEDRDQLTELVDTGQPRLLLVAVDAEPPADWDRLTDWVRLPVDDRDIWTRVVALQRRAQRLPGPRLDEYDVLWRGGSWVALSPIEGRLMATMLERPGSVFSRRALAAGAWPEGVANERLVDNYVKRLRRRIPPVGLTIHTVRLHGYFVALSP